MNLKSLLLIIIHHLDGERTIYSGFHLLKGKRSGQTLQDVRYYQLKPFFGLLPKLDKDHFDVATKQLVESGLITIDDDSIVHTTTKGKTLKESFKTYEFDGWNYRGAEQIFFARLSLFIQTISYFRVGEKSFMPIQRDREVQLFVRELFVGQPPINLELSTRIKNEIKLCLELSGVSELQREVFVHRLSGYKQTGWTWSQLSDALHKEIEELHLTFIESLHMILNFIDQSSDFPFLSDIAQNIKVSSYLTDSSQKTKQIYDQGKTIEEISIIRNLKRSTIEDHFVELSSNDEDFPIERFVTKLEAQLVLQKVNELGTKRLRVLKDLFPSLTYFQLRIILAFYARGDSH